MVERDNQLAAARNDLRNLQGQLFTERVAMSTTNQAKLAYANKA